MKYATIIAGIVISMCPMMLAQDDFNDFFKNSPLGRDRRQIESILRLKEGSLIKAESASMMEIVGTSEWKGLKFSKRIHFHNGKPSGFELYADGNPERLESVWKSICNALSKSYNKAPDVMVPKERLGEISQIGDTTGKFKCWSNSIVSVFVFIELYGNKAYIIFGQYDLDSLYIPLFDDNSDSKYLKEVCANQSGKLPDNWQSGEQPNFSTKIDSENTDPLSNSTQSRHDRLDDSPKKVHESNQANTLESKPVTPQWFWAIVAIVGAAFLGHFLIRIKQT